MTNKWSMKEAVKLKGDGNINLKYWRLRSDETYNAKYFEVKRIDIALGLERLKGLQRLTRDETQRKD